MGSDPSLLHFTVRFWSGMIPATAICSGLIILVRRWRGDKTAALDLSTPRVMLALAISFAIYGILAMLLMFG